MGDPGRNDGSITRSDLNGKDMITIVPPGGTFTPKQLQLEKRSGKLYWSDREGMRVMRANLDGSEIETLVDTSLGDSRPGSDQRKLCLAGSDAQEKTVNVDPDNTMWAVSSAFLLPALHSRMPGHSIFGDPPLSRVMVL